MNRINTGWMRQVRYAAAACAVAVSGASTFGQCPYIDFEQFALGTPINTQYLSSTTSAGAVVGSGVTFSTTGCSGATPPTIIGVPSAPSPTRALMTGGCGPNAGCLCIEFTTSQKFVEFAVSALDMSVVTNLRINAYATPGCGTGGPITISKSVVVPAAISGTFFFIPVQFDSPTCEIKRIEICSTTQGQFPMIDNVRWGLKTAANPVLTVTAPPAISCFCPNQTIFVTGTAVDAGVCEYTEKLDYSLNNPGSPVWNTISTRNTQVPTPGTLHSFPASLLPTSQELFALRVTGRNVCGGSDSTTTYVRIDRTAPVVSITCPANGQFISTLSTPFKVTGSVVDSCSASWTVRSNPPLTTIGSGSSSTSGQLAAWNPTTPDGTYSLTLTANDACGNTASTARNVILDNTPPIASILYPGPCERWCPGHTYTITGVAYDANIRSWGLDYWDSGTNSWVNITGVSGASVGNQFGMPGNIATWTVPTNIPRCCSMLRLTVDDRTNPNPCTGLPGNVSVDYRPVFFGSCSDINGSGTVTVQDLFDFLQIYFGGNPCP